ncbi:type II CRISPR RNA-guided endonuclease Cas9 [Companilactobacillus kedongensis]|uniref:type II CRISPR RNA-guided endonuclease Cas9 n=1 Tax=Companilactobacillus kedongensis TaxID=2486004 RepID=UPI000F77A36E|nr:type II CRISPR RNA-guided endonuclease Cas9 [Companilactobacillus kedongensis]
MDRKISLGLNIGVSSVGFSVIDAEAGKILELGSRLINGKVGEENLTRRYMRGSRRLNNRKKQRRKDVTKLFDQFGLIDSKNNEHYFDNFVDNSNPYELRVKGLSKQLTTSEIADSLYHIVKRRGISYDLKDVDSEAEDSEYANGLKINNLELKTQTPAQIQLKRLNEYGAIRGKVVTDNETLLNIFPTKAYLDEAKRIIKKQREFYPDILTDEFEEKYCQIVSRKRSYFVGPGSVKSRTDYGIFKTDGRILNNLFEELIGHDKIFPDELRAAGASYTAQKFDVLDDLNNLRILSYGDQKLTPKDKEQIIEELKSNTSNINMIKLIKKIANCDGSDIKGYRIDTRGKPDISSMATYRKVHRKFLDNNVDINEWPTDFFDNLSFILTLNTDNGEIRNQLENLLQSQYDFLSDDLIQLIIDNKASFDVTSSNSWHRLSIKTMDLLIPEMIKNSIGQNDLIKQMGLVKNNGPKYSKYKHLPYKKIAEDIYNPVVSKVVREALKIVNAVMKEYEHIDYIVAQMPRDKNEDEEKRNIESFQRTNSREIMDAKEEFIEATGISSDEYDKLSSNIRFKIRLWYQQKGMDLYSGRAIQPEDILQNGSKLEIDHIVPVSISFDDGINNKTLCYAEMNQLKDKMTPFEYLNEGYGQSYVAMKDMVLKNSRLNLKRRNYFYEEDIRDSNTRKRFITRNLIDTRYSSKVVFNGLHDFFDEKGIDTKVSVIRSKFTSNMRKYWQIKNSRETYHYYAIDASIIAAMPFLTIWKHGFSMFPNSLDGDVLDIKLGEILSTREYLKYTYQEPYSGFESELKNSDDRVKFSHQIDKKMNRKISDSTVYSTRFGKLAKDEGTSEYVVAKIKDIYDIDEYAKFKKIYDKDKTKFLLNKYDSKSFAQLERIMNTYPDSFEERIRGKVRMFSASPFELYRRDNGPIRKYAKKNNGPEIKQLKYLDKKVGSTIDITPANTRNKRVVLQSLKPWRTDVYLNHETNEYEIMGIKYSDLKFNKGEGYGIKRDKYLEIKHREEVSDDSEFMFTLYKKDRIKVKNIESGESVEVLFWSRTMEKQKGYAELKPIKSLTSDDELPIYGKSKRLVKRLVPKNCKIWKVNTDILGNPFYLEREGSGPKDILE